MSGFNAAVSHQLFGVVERELKLDSVEKLMAYFGIEVQQKGGE